MLRPATDDDLDHLLAWRNHPQVREMSLTQHEISVDEHASWWQRTRHDPTRTVLVYVRHDIDSGVVTFFDIDRPDASSESPAAPSASVSASASWGYYLDNAGLGQRGELLPAWIEIQRQAKRYAFDELDLATLEGEVLESNEAVRRFNRRNGFAEVEREVRDVGGEQVAVWRVRASRDRQASRDSRDSRDTERTQP